MSQTFKLVNRMDPYDGNVRFSGRHHTDLAKRAISGKLKEIYSNPEVHPMYGEHHSENVRKSISETITKLWKTSEFRTMMMSHRRYGPLSLATRKRIADAHLGKHLNDKTKEKLSIFSMKRFSNPKNHPMFGKHHSPRIRGKLSEFQKDLWKKPEHADKMWRAFCRRPNNQESECFGYIDSVVPKLFRYVGNGKLNVDGRFPDFVSTDGSKLLIEFNGEHWHKGENTRVLSRHYAKQGYRVLFIWSRELKNPERLKKKIIRFVKGGQ